MNNNNNNIIITFIIITYINNIIAVYQTTAVWVTPLEPATAPTAVLEQLEPSIQMRRWETVENIYPNEKVRNRWKHLSDVAGKERIKKTYPNEQVRNRWKYLFKRAGKERRIHLSKIAGKERMKSKWAGKEQLKTPGWEGKDYKKTPIQMRRYGTDENIWPNEKVRNEWKHLQEKVRIR